jgi:uncharacterized protein YndB with AHSA1/START domain
MEHLEYRVVINAPAKTVWKTMLEEETYKQWVAKSWPNSFYHGKWEQGEKIRFIGPEGSGTLAELVEVRPYESIIARHIALLGPGGTEDKTSEMAKGWIGITEGYKFVEKNGETTVIVTVETTSEWRKMFDDGWPGALEELRRITESQLTEA